MKLIFKIIFLLLVIASVCLGLAGVFGYMNWHDVVATFSKGIAVLVGLLVIGVAAIMISGRSGE